MVKRIDTQMRAEGVIFQTDNPAGPVIPATARATLWLDEEILKIRLPTGEDIIVPIQLQQTAFDELAVAELSPAIAWIFNYNVNPRLISTGTTGGGTVTQADDMGVISTSAAISSSADIRTIRTLNYTPGIGSLCRFTALFTVGVTGSTQVCGIGDEQDGFFIGYQDDEFGVFLRRLGIDTFVAQSSFNQTIDFTIDTTKGNVYQIRFQWLGFGNIIFSIENPNTAQFEPMHIIEYPNNNIVPSVSTPILPLFAKVENTTNNTDIVLKTASAMGAFEGKRLTPIQTNPLSLTSSTGVSQTVSTKVPILSIKNNTTFQGKANRITVFITRQIASTDGTKNVLFEIVSDATLVGASFVDFEPNSSVVALDTSATSGSGGQSLAIVGIQKDGTFSSDQVITIDVGEVITFYAESASSNDITLSVVWEEIF